MGKNDKDTSSYMNNRIPRKKTASSSLTNGGAQCTTGIHSTTTSTNEKQSTLAIDTLSSFRIPRKSKDGAPSNNKKRTHDIMSSTSIATTTKITKKVKTTATPQNNNNTTSLTVNDNNIPTYQIVKEGRVSGYPIIVSQVGSEHDAILLGCKLTDNPQEYLNNNKDGKVKIRRKFAGYNGLVPTNTVRLIKLVDGAPPIRKAAVLSGLLETGDEITVANKDGDIDLGEDEEDDDAPILKAIRSELLDNTSRADKDGDYNDQEDKDEKLVCYERSASVGYLGGKSGLAASSVDSNGTSLSTNGAGNEEIRENSFTEFNPQADEADTNSHKVAPSVVTSQIGIKSENDDADSAATDPMNNEEVVPMAVTSDINIKTEGEETDNDELRPSAVASNMNVKLEDTDDEMDAQKAVEPVASSNDVKNETEAAYGYDTDNDEPKPLVVKSNMNVKAEEEDTDDEMNTSSHSQDKIISAPKPEQEDDNVVLEFFKKLNSCLEEHKGTLGEIEEMIKSNPHLLNAKCPSEIGDIQKGYTAMEAISHCQIGADTRDLLYEFVRLGGKATNKCYEGVKSHAEYDTPLEHITVLLLSGYYPTKGHHLFLDQLADGYEEEIDNNGEELHVEVLSILHKTVKVGDNLTCGEVDSTIMNNIKQLPSLEVGVTHSKDGPMEELLKRFPIEILSDPQLSQLEGGTVDEDAPIWFKERVCVQLKKYNCQAFIKNVNGSQAVVELNNSSTQTVCHEDVTMVPPQEHDMVIVTGGGDVGVEGELACIDGEDAILQDSNRGFRIIEFVHLAKLKQNAPEKALVLNNHEKRGQSKEVPGNESTTGGKKCSVCEMTKERNDFSKTQWKKNAAAKCKDCIALKQDPEAQKKLAEERNKFLAAVYNVIGARRCSKCGIIKKKDEFKCKTWLLRPCMDCIAEQAERRRIATEEEKERKKIIVEKAKKVTVQNFEQMDEQHRSVYLFENLNSMASGLFASHENEVRKIIKRYPSLVNSKCPKGLSQIKEGFTAIEVLCCCKIFNDYVEMLLDDLVRLGAKATDKCYNAFWNEESRGINHLFTLLLSGYMPTKLKGRFFLDDLADRLEASTDSYMGIDNQLASMITSLPFFAS